MLGLTLHLAVKMNQEPRSSSVSPTKEVELTPFPLTLKYSLLNGSPNSSLLCVLNFIPTSEELNF